ncbi:hypothetical protein ACWEPC_45540 [Nonomuraea sp. NPDC004297]
MNIARRTAEDLVGAALEERAAARLQTRSPESAQAVVLPAATIARHAFSRDPRGGSAGPRRPHRDRAT